MSPIRCLALLFVLLLAMPGLATAQQPIEKQMTADEFKAAGLDKLSAAELASLNSWMTRQAGQQAAAVREQVKEERKGFGGFFDGKDQEPLVSKISGEFLGWENGTVFRLANGQRWRVIDTPLYYVPKRRASVDPAVSITPSLMGAWRLQVEGHSVRAKVQRLN